jgi:hypothetical protein
MAIDCKATRRATPGATRLVAALIGALCLLVLLDRGNYSAPAQSVAFSKEEFEVIEGVFHDGLGTFAELSLANEVIKLERLSQPPFDLQAADRKMRDAISRLPSEHPARAVFRSEIENIARAAKLGALELTKKIEPATVVRVRHTAKEYTGARAGDIVIEISSGAPLPVSVKTDKSGKIAVAEGQTPDVAVKWAERYFGINGAELDRLISELGFTSLEEMKSHYLNVAELVALVLTRSLGLEGGSPSDFSRARVTNIGAVKHLLNQLLRFKKGNDGSRVIIFERSTGKVKWESVLDGIKIDALTPDRIRMLPSRPRNGQRIASEFGIKVDGRTVVSFQIKHKRGAARNSSSKYRFSDITTRLRI